MSYLNNGYDTVNLHFKIFHAVYFCWLKNASHCFLGVEIFEKIWLTNFWWANMIDCEIES